MFGSRGTNKFLYMKKYKVSIKSSSSYLPPKVISNFDIAKKIDTSDDWIYNKLGIKERRVAENESVSEMGYKVAVSAISNANIDKGLDTKPDTDTLCHEPPEGALHRNRLTSDFNTAMNQNTE